MKRDVMVFNGMGILHTLNGKRRAKVSRMLNNMGAKYLVIPTDPHGEVIAGAEAPKAAVLDEVFEHIGEITVAQGAAAEQRKNTAEWRQIIQHGSRMLLKYARLVILGGIALGYVFRLTDQVLRLART